MSDRNIGTARRVAVLEPDDILYALGQNPLTDKSILAEMFRRWILEGLEGGAGEWQSIVVATAQGLSDALDQQATADSFLGIYFSARVTLAGDTYVEGQVATVDPNSRTVERWFVAGGDVTDAVLGLAGDNRVVNPKGLFTEAIWQIIQQGTVAFGRTVRDAVQARALIQAQRANDEPVFFVPTGTFNWSVYSFATGELWHLPPRGTVAQRLAPVTGRPFMGRLDVIPGNIAAAADLDGSYQVTLSHLPADWLTAQGCNRVDIWFGSQGIHAVSPWAPVEADLITAIIDTAEETQIGLTDQDILRVLAVFYRGNDYIAEVGGSITIGGENVGASTAEIDAAVTRYLAANPPSGEDDAARARITAIEANGWVRETRLSPTVQAALLDLRIAPVRAAITGEYEIVFANGGILRSDFWYGVEANGVQVIPRREWDSPANITFTPTADQARLMAAADAAEVTVVVTFYPDRAGIELTNHSRVVSIGAKGPKGDKGDPGSSITLTRYANAAAAPANVPAGTIAYWPRA